MKKKIQRVLDQKYGTWREVTWIDQGHDYCFDIVIEVLPAKAIKHIFVVTTEVPRGTVIQVFEHTFQVMVPK